MQLLAAYLTSPGWRDEAWARYKTYGLTLHQQLEAEPQGVFSRESSALLRSGDKRWTFPSQDEIKAAELADLKRFVSEGLSAGPIEVTIVGDISLDEAIHETALTFGALPARPAAIPKPSEARDVRFPASTAEPVRLTHKGRGDQAIALIAWPAVSWPRADSTPEMQKVREAHMLELVLQLRMIDLLRQKEGVTYSPQAIFNASWDYPGYGYIAALMEAPPEKLDGFFRDLASIAKDLREKPVTADELQRALKPEIERIQRDQASNNGYWLSVLARAQTDPRFLDAVRSSIAGLQRVTPAEIQAAAEAYLQDDKAYKLVIAPETKVASTDTTPTASK
jgi:zinc protease